MLRYGLLRTITDRISRIPLLRMFITRERRVRPASEDSRTSSRSQRWEAWVNGLRYLVVRSVVVLVTVLVGIYAAVWVTNLGGYADKPRKQELYWSVVQGCYMMHGFRDLDSEERERIIEEAYVSACQKAELFKPFVVRSFGYFRDACTLSLGRPRLSKPQFISRRGSRRVRDLLLERLPATALLFGVASVITFLGALFIALALSRRYGSRLDRTVTLLVPLLAAPSWFHGFVLIVIFAAILKILPFGGVMSPPLPETPLGYVLGMLKHMILPVSAIVLGTMPAAVYANRALFMIQSDEDYVELAQAKGLSSRRLRRRYILRPVLPAIVTNFTLIILVAWQGIVITEQVFNWPGLGRLLVEAIRSYEVRIIIGAVTLFAYLLGLSVLLLDILYVVVDPRLRLGSGARR